MLRGQARGRMMAGREKERIIGLERNVFWTGVVSFFMDASSEMVYPLVPIFLANVLGVEKSLIGLIEGVAEATASLLKVVSGRISDKIGRRKGLMAAGYGLAVLSRPFIATASLWQQVMGARFLDRFGKGVRTAPRDAIIAESVDQAHLGRAFGFHRGMDTLGAVVGPLCALVVLSYFSKAYRAVFWLSMIPGACAVAVIFCFVREKRGATDTGKKIMRPGFGPVILDWRFRLFVVISVVFGLGNSSDAFLILRAEDSGIAASMIPLVYLLFNLVYAMVSGPAGILADRFGKKRLILVGFLLFSALYYGFARVSGPAGIWWLFAAYGLFMGMSEGVGKAFVATVIPPQAKATAFGIYHAAVGLAALPASVVAGWLWEERGPAAPFYFGAAAAAVAAAMFIGLIVVDRRKER